MSEKGKKTSGILLIIMSMTLLLVSIMQSVHGNEGIVYTMHKSQNWQMGNIPTERNGNVKVNFAEEELVKLYGIGEKYAALLIKERQEHGPYFYPEDLEAVRGIGPRTLERIRPDIDLEVDEGE